MNQRRTRIAVLTSLLLVASAPMAAQTSSVSAIADGLKGKMLSLRVPHPEANLSFDANGVVIGTATHGLYTLDRDVVPQELVIRDGVLSIKATRVWYAWDAKSQAVASSQQSEEVNVSIQLPGGEVTEQSLIAALKNVFSTAQEIRESRCSPQEVEDLKASMAGDDDGKLSRRERKRQQQQHNDGTDMEAPSKSDLKITCFPSGARAFAPPGFSAPKLVVKKDPEYTDEARNARKQGTATYLVRVDEKGLPTDVLLIKSVDPTLNLKGAQALRNWRFDPATFKREAVASTIHVVINFHLY